MFDTGIFDTTLTSEVADRLFSNITDSNTLDKSFLATLRAVLRNRLEQDETVEISCKCVQTSEADFNGLSLSQQIDLFIPDALRRSITTEHSISIVYAEQPDVGARMLDVLRANVGAGTGYMDNYNRRDDLHVFFIKKFKCLFYTDYPGRNTIIFVEQLGLKQFHSLQIMIAQYLPGLFTDAPLTEAETALLKSTEKKSAREYRQLIEEFASTLDIRAEIIRGKLANFEIKHERNRFEELRQEIGAHEAEYEQHLTTMRDTLNKIQELKYTLAGLECSIGGYSGDSELMEYFMCNKRLTLVNVAGTSIEFIVHGYADIYDEDAFEKYAGNHNGFFYNNLSSSVTKEQMEKLYRAIFGEGKYKLRLCAAYKADIKNSLRPLTNYTFPQESATYLPNPHIQRHGCIGGYSAHFQEYMQRRDYVGAINQAVASARNLNFFDSAVIQRFTETLSKSKLRCIEKPDGTLLSPKEAIQELEGV